MRKVVAAVDNSAAAKPVLDVARAVAELLATEAVALHVREDGTATARALAGRAAVALTILEGDPVPTLVSAIAEEDEPLVVVGCRGQPAGVRPAGHTVLALAQQVTAPLLVVPPDITGRWSVSRALLPLDGSMRTAVGVRDTVAVLSGAGIDIVAVHVFDTDHLPRYVDQPQHDLDARRHEFLARHADLDVHLELRSGIAWDGVLRCARDVDADILLLGWSQDLSAGHAAVVREALARSLVPVLLVPLGTHTAEPAAHLADERP